MDELGHPPVHRPSLDAIIVWVLNLSTLAMQEMLDMLRDHQNNCHSVRLEWIVIWYVVLVTFNSRS